MATVMRVRNSHISGMDSKHITGEWLKTELESLGLTQAALARSMGVDASVISKFLKGTRQKLSDKEAHQVRDFLARHRPFEVIDGGEVDDDRDLVPIVDIQVSAGPGRFAEEYDVVASQLSFPRNYLRRITTTHPAGLAIVSVTGNSMVPTLHHDDIVMVDSTKKNIAYDGMFVVMHNGLLKVKRLKKSRDGRSIELRSDNEQFGSEDCDPQDVEIIGRVVWSGRKEF